MNSGNLNFLEPSGPIQASNGTALFFLNTTWCSQYVAGDILAVFLFMWICRGWIFSREQGTEQKWLCVWRTSASTCRRLLCVWVFCEIRQHTIASSSAGDKGPTAVWTSVLSHFCSAHSFYPQLPSCTRTVSFTTVTSGLGVFSIATGEARGYGMAQLVEAVRYKLEGHGLHSRWCHWNFSLT